MDSKAFEGLAWGLFVVLLGVGWFVEAETGMETSPYVSLGVGLILIGLNGARVLNKTRLSKFSLFIGLVALAMGITGILGYKLELLPTIIILIGLFIIGQAVTKLSKQ